MPLGLAPTVKLGLIAIGGLLVIGGLILKAGDLRNLAKIFLVRILPVLILIIALAGLMTLAVRNRPEPGLLPPLDSALEFAIKSGHDIQQWIASHAAAMVRWGTAAVLLGAGVFFLRGKERSRSPIALIFSIGMAGLGWFWMKHGRIPAGAFFLGASALFALYAALTSPPPGEKSPLPERPAAFLPLAALLLVTALLRVYQLYPLPPRFDFDEAIYGMEAIKVLEGRHPVSLWLRTDWRGLAHSSLSPPYIYALSLYFRLFGANLTALRLVPVTCGTLSVLLLYLSMKILFDRRLGLIAAYFLAISPTAINYSRCGLLLISTQTAGLLILYLLLRTIRLQDRRAYFFLGLVFVFAGFMYSPIREFIMVVAFLLFLHVFFKWGFLFRHWWGILMMVATTAAVGALLAIPVEKLLYPEIVDYESVWHRTQSHMYTPQPDYDRAIPLIAENFQKLIVSLFVEPHFNYDPWPRGNLYVNPALAALAVPGLIIALANFRRASCRLLLFFFAIFALPNLLSRPPVMTRRLLYFMPMLFTVAALPLYQLLRGATAIAPVWGGRLLAVMTTLFCLLVGSYDSFIFFRSNEPAGRWEEERVFDEHVKSLLPSYYVYVFPYWISYSPMTIDFLCYEKIAPGPRDNFYRYIKPREAEQLVREEENQRRAFAFVFYPQQGAQEVLNRVAAGRPGTQVQEVRDKFGRLQALSCRFEPPDY